MEISHVWRLLISINAIWRPNYNNNFDLYACLANTEHEKGYYPDTYYKNELYGTPVSRNPGCLIIAIEHYSYLPY